MNLHQSYVLLQDLSSFFHHWFNLSNFHPGVSQQFMVVFSLYKSNRCIIQVFSNKLMISSFSCIYNLTSIVVHLQILPGVSLYFVRSFSILMVVRSRFHFLRYHINSFVVSIPSVVPSIPSQACAISILILFTRISSMPNPLVVINLNWWRIRIT